MRMGAGGFDEVVGEGDARAHGCRHGRSATATATKALVLWVLVVHISKHANAMEHSLLPPTYGGNFSLPKKKYSISLSLSLSNKFHRGPSSTVAVQQ